MFFDPRKAEKFLKLAKNGVDAVKGTVLATPRGLSAAPCSILCVSQHQILMGTPGGLEGPWGYHT